MCDTIIFIYFSNIRLKTDLLTFRVAAAVFRIAGGMRRFPAYFDNPGGGGGGGDWEGTPRTAKLQKLNPQTE